MEKESRVERMMFLALMSDGTPVEELLLIIEEAPESERDDLRCEAVHELVHLGRYSTAELILATIVDEKAREAGRTEMRKTNRKASS